LTDAPLRPILRAIHSLIVPAAGRFAHNWAIRPKSATIGGASSSYAYDGDGKRASKTVGGTTTSFVYDINTSLPVVLDDGTRKYVWGLGLAYAVSGSSVEVYHTDGLGSVRAITAATGVVTQTYRTDEFGVPVQTQGTSTNPFQYTGEQRDGESGFVFLRARMYDPQIGRFLSRDLWGGTKGSPLSQNRFSYVLNNPVNLIDPSGLKSKALFDPCGQLGGLGGIRFWICSQLAKGEGETQAPRLLPCPANGQRIQNGLRGFANYQYVAGPEKSGGGLYNCHVNVTSGNVRQHIEYDHAASTFHSDVMGPLGSNPVVAGMLAAVFAAGYIAEHGGDPQRLVEYYDWYIGVGRVIQRLNDLTLYAP
jgi:RHS repeat-associated protein